MFNMHMPAYSISASGETLLVAPAYPILDTRLFGSVETRPLNDYTGPYGVLIEDTAPAILSVATNSANHCVQLQNHGELV